MKTIHLLATDEPATALAPLVAAAAAAGFRVGWLDLGVVAEPSPSLESPVRAGFFRSVARSEAGIVTAKRVRGAPVVEDLLREHFLGCRLVFVRGESEAPRLSRRGERWLVESASARLELTTESLVARLRRPAVTWLAGAGSESPSAPR